MQGALLRSGKSESFTALGETGQPVYRAALQLREAIRRKSATIVDHLAIPQSNELGNIDWYSPIAGDVIPWSAATEAERAPARAQLEVLKTALEELSERFLAADGDQPLGDKAVFGKLLKRVINFPDQDFVYLVNGTPVLTFWGFEKANADRSLSPLHCLYPSAEPVIPAPAAVPPVAPAAAPLAPVVEIVRKRSWWRRWWWLLPLLLLLLLLLLFGLRSCVPAVTIPGLGALPGFDVPKLPSIDVPRGGVGSVPGLNGGATPADGAAAPGLPAMTAADPAAAPAAAEPAPTEPAATPAEPATPPAPEPAAQPPGAEPGPAPEPSPVTPPTLPAGEPPAANQALSIPANANNGVADFLNGQWRAGAGIQDRRTGKPLRLEYQFKNGQGDVTVHRADGVACSGPVAAAMNAGSLSIDSKGQAACADGSHYDMPKITCKQGAKSAADCTGGYANEQFPLSMRQTGE